MSLEKLATRQDRLNDNSGKMTINEGSLLTKPSASLITNSYLLSEAFLSIEHINLSKFFLICCFKVSGEWKTGWQTLNRNHGFKLLSFSFRLV